MSDRHLIIVGGPNGAGKTTFAREDILRHGGVYIGADAIAAEIAPDNPTSAALEAGALFIERSNAALQSMPRIVVESTLSGKTLANYLRRAMVAGYRITIQFVYLASGDECVARIQQRVRKGGHGVPEVDIRRRYWRSLRNFWNLYRELAHEWVVIYNQSEQPEIVAFGDQESSIHRNIDRYIEFRLLVEQGENDHA